MGQRLRRDSEVSDVVREIVAFRDEREWGQFHTPRNLAAAIAIEAGELQELLLWKKDEDAATLLASPRGLLDASREVADVLIFVLLLCTELGIDPIHAIRAKLVENRRKYPVATAKGNSLKYTQLPANEADHVDTQYALDLHTPTVNLM